MGQEGTAQPIRILYINHVGQVSGAEESLLEVLAALDRNRIIPTVACPAGPLAERVHALGIAQRRIPQLRYRRSASAMGKLNYGVRWVRAIVRLRHIIDAERIALVHSNSTQAHLAAGVAARRCRVPAIWHVRDLTPLRGLGRYLSRHADSIVAISRAVAAHLYAQAVEPHKVSVIYNGIDAETYAARAKENPFAREASTRLVTMAAQMVPWKRHEDFIRAMSVAQKMVPEGRGLIVGADIFREEAAYRARLERLARELGAAQWLVFLGYRADLPAILGASDVVVVPSAAEPFGRVALEAMALGRPVVGTRAGGLPELVIEGETGLLVGPGDWRALGAAIARLLQDTSLAIRLGQQGMRRVREQFGIAATVRALEDLYQKMLSCRRSKRGR